MELKKSWITLCQSPSLLLCLWKMILSYPSDILILPLAMYKASKGLFPAPSRNVEDQPFGRRGLDVEGEARSGAREEHNSAVKMTWQKQKLRKDLSADTKPCHLWLRSSCVGGVTEPAVLRKLVFLLGFTPAACWSLNLTQKRNDLRPPFDKNPTNNSLIHSQAGLPGVFSIHGGDRDCTNQEWHHVPLVTASLGQQA